MSIPFKKLQKQNPKILLVHPSLHYTGTDTFPLGLGYIASYLKQYTNNIVIWDEQKFQMGRNQLFQLKPDIVGISATSPSYSRVVKFLKSIKTMQEPIRPLVIMGGVHATYCPEEVLNAGVDVVFRSEADISLNEFFENRPKNYDDLRHIPGIAWLDELGFLQQTLDTQPVPKEEMDLLPFPARELFDKDKYQIMSITTSRGCPYACAYCSATNFWGYSVRFHSVDYVERELEQIASLGYNFICFEDATFSVNIKRAMDICDCIITNPKLQSLTWSCETRPDRMTLEMLKKFEQARCLLVMLGVESGSDIVLKANNRTVPVVKVHEAMKIIRQTEIPVQTLMIFGLPGETEETVNETIKFLQNEQPDHILISLATAYPGTELWLMTRRINPPLSWRRKFNGHGENSELYLPEGMTEQQYIELAEKLLNVIQEINFVNGKMFKTKQRNVIKLAKATNPLL